jgi:hypothetical protein
VGSLTHTLRSPTLIPKRILVPTRLRRPPATGWSWTDGRFVREHMDHLSREAVLRMSLPALLQARDELLARDLIAHEPPLTQVLSMPPPRDQRRRCEPGQGPTQLGEILRRAIASTQPNQERILP